MTTQVWVVEHRIATGHWVVRPIVYPTRGAALDTVHELVENAGYKREHLRTVKFVRHPAKPEGA